jgi:hypothetical protein
METVGGPRRLQTIAAERRLEIAIDMLADSAAPEGNSIRADGFPVFAKGELAIVYLNDHERGWG